MSKAFTKDEGEDKSAVIVPRRAPLPAGVPNYVTESGMAALRAEHAALAAERARLEGAADPGLTVVAARLSDLEARIASASLVDAAAQPRDEVRFGATVTVRDESGAERGYRIVGVDEADAARGRIAFVAPLARALLGKRVGEAATLRTPGGGEEELEVLSIAYG
jgi:transcription elongation factor GreB